VPENPQVDVTATLELSATNKKLTLKLYDQIQPHLIPNAKK